MNVEGVAGKARVRRPVCSVCRAAFPLAALPPVVPARSESRHRNQPGPSGVEALGLPGQPSEMVGKTSLWAVGSHLVRPGKPALIFDLPHLSPASAGLLFI